MTKEEYYNKLWNESVDNVGCFGHVTKVVVLLLLVLLFSSCASKTKIEYRDRDVNHYITSVVHDTIIDKSTDSVYVLVTTKGDTIYKNVYRERTRWRDRVIERHDTCWRDSVVIEHKEEIKEVVKYPKTYWLWLGVSIISVIFATTKLIRWLQIH